MTAPDTRALFIQCANAHAPSEGGGIASRAMDLAVS
jgi:hypothetical protein